MINRRSFLQGSGAVAGLSAMGLSGCARHVIAPVAPTAAAAPALPFYDAVGPIIPIRADMDRIFRITVCTRPFRPAGPRQDVERVGDKVVVHNYGHGGSGWSLSWGSADVVVRKVLAEGSAQREVAVIGAGAAGGIESDDLRPGESALRAVSARDGLVDTGFADCTCLGGSC
jgi:D-amino-acid oxidase